MFFLSNLTCNCRFPFDVRAEPSTVQVNRIPGCIKGRIVSESFEVHNTPRNTPKAVNVLTAAHSQYSCFEVQYCMPHLHGTVYGKGCKKIRDRLQEFVLPLPGSAQAAGLSALQLSRWEKPEDCKSRHLSRPDGNTRDPAYSLQSSQEPELHKSARTLLRRKLTFDEVVVCPIFCLCISKTIRIDDPAQGGNVTPSLRLGLWNYLSICNLEVLGCTPLQNFRFSREFYHSVIKTGTQGSY